MKKTRTCIMLLSAVLLFGSCGPTKPTEPTETDAGMSQIVVPEVEDSLTQDESMELGMVGENSPHVLAACISTGYEKKKYTDNYERCLYSISWDELKLPEACYETIGYAIDGFNAERRKEGELMRETIEKASADLVRSLGNDAPELAAESKLYVHRSDDKLLSLSSTNYTFLGGAHPSIQKMGYTFDVASGLTVPLEKVLKDEALFLTLCEAQLKEINIFEQRGFDDTYLTTLRRELETAPQWWMDADILYVYFEAGVFGPYAAGDVTLQLLCAEVVAPEYLPNTQGRVRRLQVQYIDEFMATGYALGPGCVLLHVTPTASDGWDQEEEVSFICDGVETRFTLSGDLTDVFRVETEDRSVYFCWYLESVGMNDYHEVAVFRYTDKLEKCGSIPGGFYGGFAGYPEDMALFRYVDGLGTYKAAFHASLGEDGLPVVAEESYAPITWPEMHTIKTVRELPVWQGEKRLTLSAGTEMSVVRIVPGSSRYVRTLAGEVYEIKVEVIDGYIRMIEGVSEDDYFESLPYAG